MSQSDATEALRQSVADAVRDGCAVSPAGGGSKSFLGRESVAKPLVTTGHQGVINYQPSELVITARAGSLLSDIETVLAEKGQMLAFEPPGFSASATLGGVVASGLSGPRRPFSGAVRDFALGCKMINGQGEILSFGGEVMKNVAGYDVSRLMAGSMGTLGLLLEISLKVLPRPNVESTYCFELPRERAMQVMIDWQAKCLPLSGLAYDGNVLRIRLSGGENAVKGAARKLGGEVADVGDRFWRELNEQQLPFFNRAGNLWRISLPPAAPEPALSGEWLYDWGGALRWLKSNEPVAKVFEQAAKFEGHATLFRGENRQDDVFQPLSGKLFDLHKNLKKAFDPRGIFNPGRIGKRW